MTILEMRDRAAALYDREDELGKEAFYAALDEFGSLMGQPRLMVLHLVRRLPKIDREEIVAHPELNVAHWLVLADLIPTDRDFRRFWIHRCKFMGFTAKAMRVELAGAVELQRAAAAGEVVLRERKK